MCFMKIVNTNRIRLISEIVNFHEFPIWNFVKRNEKPLEVRPRNCHFGSFHKNCHPMLIRKSLSGLWKKRHIANVLFCWRKRPKRRFRPEIYKRCLYFEHIECILVGNNCNDDETSRSKWFFWGYLTPKMRLISAYCASKPILLIQRALEKLSSTKTFLWF